MPDLELRRKVAVARGLESLRTGDGCCALHAKNYGCVPEWDCDLSAAGALWAEMAQAGRQVNLSEAPTPDDDGFVGAWAWDQTESDGAQVGVAAVDVPDAKERLCIAICKLWLAWKVPS